MDDLIITTEGELGLHVGNYADQFHKAIVVARQKPNTEVTYKAGAPLDVMMEVLRAYVHGAAWLALKARFMRLGINLELQMTLLTPLDEATLLKAQPNDAVVQVELPLRDISVLVLVTARPLHLRQDMRPPQAANEA